MLPLLLLLSFAPPASTPFPDGFHLSPHTGEIVLERWIEPGVRVIINAPAKPIPNAVQKLIVFATPNGNTVEQTLGSAVAEGTDWHFGIQHVAAQVRKLRELKKEENIVLACIEAEGLSWPAWRAKQGDKSAALARQVVEEIKKLAPAKDPKITLTCHSGGGSFLFAYIEGGETIPKEVERIAWLDANYSYDDAKHADKLFHWLAADEANRLNVIAYDDREIKLNGKNVVGPTGGTFRATGRMLDGLGKRLEMKETKEGDIRIHTSPTGNATAKVHLNPQNKILHTVLVGDMNGVLEVLGEGTAWGKFGGERAYLKYLQPAVAILDRAKDAIGGKEFVAKAEKLEKAEREESILAEAAKGNIPDFLRTFKRIEVKGKDTAGKQHTVAFDVMPDYLAIGTNDDWVRMPMTPETAQSIADAYGCALPTRKMVDLIHKEAAVKLEPMPLTKDREAWDTFLQHHQLIEEQRKDRRLGDLVSGIKKDIVVTNRLEEKPKRVAIYGWHKLDGAPIQPLTIVHVNWYVDYSHGARLVKRTVLVDGKPMDLRYLLHSSTLHPLLSDEGPIRRPAY